MKVLVIGSGKLGLHLVRSLRAFCPKSEITISTTRQDKIPMLSAVADQVFLWDCKDPLNTRIVNTQVSFDLIIGVVAPKINGLRDVWPQVAQGIADSNLKTTQLIWISSTGVYPKHETPAAIDESAQTLSATSSPLVQAEKIILAAPIAQKSTIILRLAGLHGGAEYPLKNRICIWKQRQLQLSPFTPQNLTHIDLVADVVCQLTSHPQLKKQEIIHVCDDSHPTRQELADKVCQNQQHEAISFQGHEHGRGGQKKIFCLRLKQLEIDSSKYKTT